MCGEHRKRNREKRDSQMKTTCHVRGNQELMAMVRGGKRKPETKMVRGGGGYFETKTLKLRSELERLLNRVFLGDMRSLFRKFGLVNFTRGKLDSYLGSCDEEMMHKLIREIRNFLDENRDKGNKAKGCPALKIQNCNPIARSAVKSESQQVLNQDERPYIPMSPGHAARAAMLKRRFAETIFKATHPEFDLQSSDSLCRQRARERLRKKKQQQEKARIHDEKENSKRLKLERERAAARLALEAMEKTAVIKESCSLLKELEMLCYGSSSDMYYGVLSPNTLERVGLYLKEEYYGDEELEEGEMAC